MAAHVFDNFYTVKKSYLEHDQSKKRKMVWTDCEGQDLLNIYDFLLYERAYNNCWSKFSTLS